MPMSPRRYQPPKSAGGGGAYMGGAAIGRSAANAAVDNNVAAPAAIINLTLRIGIVLLAGEATTDASHRKSTCGRCQQKLKQHLTLIFKVDIFSPANGTAPNVAMPVVIANEVLTKTAPAAVSAAASCSTGTPRAARSPAGRRRRGRRRRCWCSR